jgi:hypothetical protein
MKPFKNKGHAEPHAILTAANGYPSLLHTGGGENIAGNGHLIVPVWEHKFRSPLNFLCPRNRFARLTGDFNHITAVTAVCANFYIQYIVSAFVHRITSENFYFILWKILFFVTF